MRVCAKKDTDFQIIKEPEAGYDKPKMYRVLLHNDDYTPQDFVVEILKTVFHKPHNEARKIMLDVHHKGIGIVGKYTYDVAITKVDAVHTIAEQNEYPLRCSCEQI